jgi:hypothetical protein
VPADPPVIRNSLSETAGAPAPQPNATTTLLDDRIVVEPAIVAGKIHRKIRWSRYSRTFQGDRSQSYRHTGIVGFDEVYHCSPIDKGVGSASVEHCTGTALFGTRLRYLTDLPSQLTCSALSKASSGVWVQLGQPTLAPCTSHAFRVSCGTFGCRGPLSTDEPTVCLESHA